MSKSETENKEKEYIKMLNQLKNNYLLEMRNSTNKLLTLEDKLTNLCALRNIAELDMTVSDEDFETLNAEVNNMIDCLHKVKERIALYNKALEYIEKINEIEKELCE